MEFCSMLHGSLDGRGVWERTDTCTCMAESVCCSLETITTLVISYSPLQNKKFFKKNYVFSTFNVPDIILSQCRKNMPNLMQFTF